MYKIALKWEGNMRGYDSDGRDVLTKEKLEKAIRIGESHCSIANMLVKACPVEFSYQLNGESYKLGE